MSRTVIAPAGIEFGRYLGATMKMARKRGGVKAHVVAEDIGVTEQAVSAWETGKSLPQINNLQAYCSVIGWPIWRVMAYAERAYRMAQTMKQDHKHARMNEENDDE